MVQIRRPNKLLCKNARNYFKEYCNNSSIHGFKYFGENRSYFERIWWFVVFVITLCIALYSIMQVYQKWIKSPVIVTFSTMETPIYTIPFPSVTICPESKTAQYLYSHQKVVNDFFFNRNVSDEDLENLRYMGLICERDLAIEYPDNEFITDEIYSKLDSLSPSMPMFYCQFMGKDYPCDELFTKVFTEEGLCYTFNTADNSDIYRENVYFHSLSKVNHSKLEWSLEEGYSKDAGLKTYPRRALLSDITNSLIVNVLFTHLDLDKTCKKGNQGLKVALHTATRIPRMAHEYFRVPLDEVVIAGVTPNMIRTNSRLEYYDVSQRHCYFSYEKHLKYFKIYTPKNCRMECVANYTLYYCGCVPFYMPRENSTNICGLGSFDCAQFAEQSFQSRSLRNDLGETLESLDNKDWPHEGEFFAGDLPDCECLPLCSDLTYNVETSQSKWNWLESFPKRNSSAVLMKMLAARRSKLILYMKPSDFIFSERNELYGPLDFLANFGGLLGLFTGFSMLSVMEALYFFTLRMFCNVRIYGHWSGKDHYSFSKD
ncbi:unnamed protein product [Phyllotreta striolata]|uniref:Uncharacterized protein n=1 Tax=Phyllotreta striolata TaxID=444603 RepID=A0A9N9XQH5_PHYSR|nr:unnamed protein product [Phyllotreta striolata]